MNTATYDEMIHLPLYDSDTGIQVGNDPVEMKTYYDEDTDGNRHVQEYYLVVTSNNGQEHELVSAKPDAKETLTTIMEMVNTECVRNKWQFDTAEVTVETFERAVDAAAGVIEWKELTK